MTADLYENPIDRIMAKASAELLETRYLDCEAACVEALALALVDQDYDRIARIMLPLQEARRQRRQIAEDAGAFVISQKLTADEILETHPQGLLMLMNPPYEKQDELDLVSKALSKGCYVEVLLMTPEMLRDAFCEQHEKRGDRLWRSVKQDQPAAMRMAEHLSHLPVVGDHEKAHQRAAEAARDALLGR